MELQARLKRVGKKGVEGGGGMVLDPLILNTFQTDIAKKININGLCISYFHDESYK